jgi:hypothetical protein
VHGARREVSRYVEVRMPRSRRYVINASEKPDSSFLAIRGVVVHATRDFTVTTVHKAVALAVKTGSRLYTDSAGSYRALKGYVHDFVNHTQKE